VVVPMTQTPSDDPVLYFTHPHRALVQRRRDRFDFEGLLLFCHAADVPIRSGKIPARRPRDVSRLCSKNGSSVS